MKARNTVKRPSSRNALRCPTSTPWHRGVLFLDEFPEFGAPALEAMREPLEAGSVTISRARGSVTFPARFLLVAAMNPCPCGYYGDSVRSYSCAEGAVSRYQRRISDPLLDRLDLFMECRASSSPSSRGSQRANGQASCATA